MISVASHLPVRGCARPGVSESRSYRSDSVRRREPEYKLHDDQRRSGSESAPTLAAAAFRRGPGSRWPASASHGGSAVARAHRVACGSLFRGPLPACQCHWASASTGNVFGSESCAGSLALAITLGSISSRPRNWRRSWAFTTSGIMCIRRGCSA